MTYTAPIRLEQGDEVRCPHCRLWHPAIAPHSEGTLYTMDMLYWECAKGRYFAITPYRQPASDAATDPSSVIRGDPV